MNDCSPRVVILMALPLSLEVLPDLIIIPPATSSKEPWSRPQTHIPFFR